MKNYSTETDLQGLFPAVSEYMHTGKTTFDTQKTEATRRVLNDLIAAGFNLRKLQTPLILRASGTVLSADETLAGIEDEITRNRLVYNVTTFTAGTKSIILQGSSDETVWITIKTIVPTATGEASVFFENTFKHYRLKTTVSAGTLDYEAYLVETVYDSLFLYKWAQLIMFDSVKEQGDQFTTKYLAMEKDYAELLNKAKIYYDENEDGEITEYEDVSMNQIRIHRG